jgi:hypothetical protein
VAATAFPNSPLNQIPQIDGPNVTGTPTVLREAPYINAWIAGPSANPQLAWLQSIRIQNTYEDFQLMSFGGTFVRQAKAGSRLYTITITRNQGILQPLVALIRHAWGLPQNSDVRFDRYPVNVMLSYEYNGVASGQNIVNEQWQFPRAFAAGGWDTGLMTSPTSASDETITFLATSMIYISTNKGAQQQTTDKPQPPADWPVA